MLAEVLRENLLTLAIIYGAAEGIDETAVSFRIYKRSSFLEQFRAGKCSVSIDKMDEMLRRFSELWPKGTSWPKLRACNVTRRPSVKTAKNR